MYAGRRRCIGFRHDRWVALAAAVYSPSYMYWIMRLTIVGSSSGRSIMPSSASLWLKSIRRCYTDMYVELTTPGNRTAPLKKPERVHIMTLWAENSCPLQVTLISE